MIKSTKSISQDSIMFNSSYDKSFATVDNLPNVKTIRHYTTMDGLIGILNSKKIKANKSVGDEDWSELVLHDKKVVSVLDSRADSEFKNCIKRNKSNGTLEGYTEHLALHMKKICVCIEIDYDKLEPYLDRKMRTLNKLEQSVHKYVDRWNRMIDDGRIDDFKSIKWIYDQLKTSQGSDLSKFKYNPFWESPTEAAKELLDKIPYNIDEDTKKWIGKNWFSSIIRACEGSDSYIKDLSRISTAIDIYEKYKPKRYTKQDEDDLRTAVGTYNAIDILRILRSHGWHKDMCRSMYVFPSGPDNEIGYLANNILETDRSRYIDGKWTFINEKGRGARAISKMIPEMRIPCDVPISPNYCKIIIFEGMVKGTKSSSQYQKVKSLLSDYEVVIYPESSDIPDKARTMSQKRVAYFSKLKCFATYGGGPHHTVVAHKDGGGRWRVEIIDEDYQSVREAFKNTDPSKETYKVYRLD